MSKRFGRNQRRAARERIAALETKVAMDGVLLRHISDKKAQLEQEIVNAKRMVGRMSVLFEPDAKRFDGPTRDQVQAFSQSAVMEDSAPFFHAKSEVIPLDVMIAKVKKADPAAFNSAIHCQVTFDDGRWHYAISESAMDAMPEDILVERIARDLAMTIGQDLKKIKPGLGVRLY